MLVKVAISGTQFVSAGSIVDLVIGDIKRNADALAQREFDEQDKQLCLEYEYQK